MQNAHTSTLTAFREALAQRDWPELHRLAAGLLLQIGLDEFMGIAMEYVESYLPKFQNRYPTIMWPSKHLEAIREAAVSGRVDRGWTPGERGISTDEYETPGTPSFLEAISYLGRMILTIDDIHRCAELATDAISSVFMANLDEHWGKKYPQLWRQDRTAEGGLIAVRYFANDPEVDELGTAQWLEFADEIAKRLPPR